MSRKPFVEHHLGPWSSHPAYLDARMRRWMWISLVPLAAGIALFLAAWRLGAVPLTSLVLDWDTWVPAVFSLLAVGFSFCITVMLAGRASTIAGTSAPAGSPRHMKWWAFVLATGLVSGLAFLLSRGAFVTSVFSGDWVARIRILGYLLGTAPLFALLLYLEFKGRNIDEWGNADASPPSRWRQLRRFLTLAGIFAGYVFPMVWIDRIADALSFYAEYLKDPASIPSDSVLQEFLRWMPFLRNVDLTGVLDAVASMAVFVPLGCMTFFALTTALWFFGLRTTRVAPVPPEEVVRAEGYELRPSGETWWVKARDYRRPSAERWVRTDTEDAAPSKPAEAQEDGDGSGPPAWLGKLQREAKARHSEVEWSEPHRASLGETSELSRRDDLLHLFLLAAMGQGAARAAPTKDQVAALEQFDKLYEDFQRAEDREGQCVFPSMDLLVSGSRGSGRTTLLFACALHAVVLRGQAVLVLVPTPEKAEVFVDRLRDVATRSGVGWYVAVSLLQRDQVLSWADPAAGKNPNETKADKHCLSPNGALPDILVGTPHDYERLLFGADSQQAMVRRSLLRMQCVLIEDLSEFLPTERRHLPFLVDKHRLVLGGEHLPVQFLALTQQVTDTASDYLSERLFSEKSPVSHVRLRPCEGPEPWVVDVAGDEPAELLEELAESCAEGNLDVIVWRPGVAKEECDKLAARLGRAGSQPMVVSDLDQIHPDNGMKADAAIYRSASTRHHTLALRSRLHGEEMVILRVTIKEGLQRADEVAATLPVLPSIASEALFVSHLASGVRHLAPFTPIPRDLWARIGLRSVGSLRRGPIRDAKFNPYPGYRLVLDPPEPKAALLAAARDQEWAWVALQVDQIDKGKLPSPPAVRQVEMFRPIDRSRQLRMNPSRHEVYLGTVAASENRSGAGWVTTKEENLDRMDLAYADTLLHTHGSSRFFPERIEEDKFGFRIYGTPYRDRGEAESYMPIWDVLVQVPAKIGLALSQGGVAPSVLRWAEFRDPDAEARLVVECQFRLLGTYDEVGEPSLRTRHLALDYPTKLTALLIGARRQGADESSLERDEQLRDCMKGAWATAKGAAGERSNGKPWPLLSLVLTASLRERLPGLFDFCRLVAFRGPQDGANDDRAVVFFIEPTATRNTVWDVTKKLQLDSQMLADLIQNVIHRLERLVDDNEHLDALRNLMVEAAVSFGAGAYEGHANGRNQLQADLQDALALMGKVREQVDMVRERRSRRRSSTTNGDE